MERENAGIGEVINAVESASAAELKELALIRKTVESLKDNPRVPRSVAASAREIEQAKNEDAPATANEIAAAMKQLNLGQAPAIRTPSEKASVIPTPAAPQSPPAPKPSTQAESAQRRASDASKESITPA
ncbi:lytic transglycosylase domain-containing protein, partial [Klebsiella pneumoniae]|nr:lytic transglycosylase domain-containing protein [Klebsiella pneumoniae]